MYRTWNHEIHKAREIHEAITDCYDITERRQLLSEYRCWGYLDRDHAVRIIYDLRGKDPLDFFARLMNLPYGSFLTEQMADQYICAELEWQIAYLEAKCGSKMIAPLFQIGQEVPHANP